MFLYDGLSQYFEEYFEEGYHSAKALKKRKKRKKESKALQPLFVVVDDSDLEMLNKKNKRAAVFCNSSVHFIDKYFDVENSHCDIFFRMEHFIFLLSKLL